MMKISNNEHRHVRTCIAHKRGLAEGFASFPSAVHATAIPKAAHHIKVSAYARSKLVREKRRAELDKIRTIFMAW